MKGLVSQNLIWDSRGPHFCGFARLCGQVDYFRLRHPVQRPPRLEWNFPNPDVIPRGTVPPVTGIWAASGGIGHGGCSGHAAGRGIIGSSQILLARAATLEPSPFHRWVETGFERLGISGTDHVGTHFPGNQQGRWIAPWWLQPKGDLGRGEECLLKVQTCECGPVRPPPDKCPTAENSFKFSFCWGMSACQTH